MLKDIPLDLLEALLENPNEQLILVDADGIVRFVSKASDGMYPVPIEGMVGKHISEVSPTTGLPRVLKTGKAEIGRSMILQGKKRIAARIPLFKDGCLIGAAGKMMFKSPEVLKQLYEHIDSLENRIDYYKDTLKSVCGGRYTFDSTSKGQGCRAAGGRVQCAGSDHRRVGHRQGTVCPRHSQVQPKTSAKFCAGELRGYSFGVDRIRTLWL